MKRKDVIAKATTCLNQLGQLVVQVDVSHLSADDMRPTQARQAASIISSFLAAHLIVYHPKNIFESMGSMETSLCESAKQLLTNFDAVKEALDQICRMSPDPMEPYGLLKPTIVAYASSLFSYVELFLVWKAQDQARLSERVCKSLLSLRDALREASLNVKPEEAAGLRATMLTQADSLRGQLLRIAGAEALAKFDLECPELAGASGSGPAMLQGASGSGPSMSATSAWLEKPNSNEQLAHELLLDPSYRLPAEADAEGGMHELDVKAVMRRAFWSGVEDDLCRSPPYYGRVLRVLVQVRDGVAAVAPAAIKSAVCELVDEHHIRQQAEHGTYDWRQCVALFSALVEHIGHAQLKERRAETETEWAELRKKMEATVPAEQPRMLCRGLRFVLWRANVLRTDAGNMRFLRLAPAIAQHGVEYERKKFHEKLRSGALPDQLPSTTAWLRSALSRSAINHKLLSEVAAGVPAAHRAVLADATATLASEPDQGEKNMPETLLLDAARLLSYRDFFERAIGCSKIILAIRTTLAGFGFLKTEIDAAAAAIADALLGQEPLRNTAGAAHQATDAVLALCAEACERCRGAAADAVRASMHLSLTAAPDHVDTLLRKRLVRVWKWAAAGAIMTGAPEECGLGAGLDAVAPAVARTAARLGRMAAVNQEVHGALYSQILIKQAVHLLATATLRT